MESGLTNAEILLQETVDEAMDSFEGEIGDIIKYMVEKGSEFWRTQKFFKLNRFLLFLLQF